MSAPAERLVRKLAPETERTVRRPRFSEDALVRALDYCDEAGMRFGQFVIAVVAELAMEGDVISHKMAGSEHLAAVERVAFYIENGALEESMRKFVEKRRREAQDLIA